MPEFAWRAADASGRLSEGTLGAETATQAARQLQDRGLVPVSVQATDPGSSRAGPDALSFLNARSSRGARGPVNAADVLALTSELAIMLRAGLTLAHALRVLIDMSYKPAVGQLLQAVLDDVKGGAPLSRALGRQAGLFGDFYLNMVRSGEASGQLAAVLTRLVEHMERIRALRESVVSALIYPGILLFVSVVSLFAMLGFVVPQFEQLFNDMGDALPLATKIVLRVGQVFRQWGIVLTIVIAGVAWLAIGWLKTPAGAAWWQGRALRMPVFGSLMVKYQLNLFARTFGTLLGNGVPLLTALHIASETVGNQVLRAPLASLAPAVKEGRRLADAMSATRIFEPLAVNLVRVGEETGRLGSMMLELANILNRDVEVGIRRALTLIEPLLIIVLGLLIAGIIGSIMLGILSINDLAV